MTERRTASVGLYATAFGLMLAAGAVLVAAAIGSLTSFALMWLSSGLSAAAILVAAASVLLPRRRE